MSGTATIEYVLRGTTATIWIKDLASLSDAVSLAGWLAPYTNAAIGRVGFTVSQELNTAEGTEEFQDMLLYGSAFFRNESNNVVKFVWPAPKMDLYDIINSRYVLKQINGEALATILGMMTGHVLTFRHGSVCSR